MPRRTDISSICLIGSGPIVIGQACEFDYSGCQALKVLREDGFRTIVVNSNPATIMTDPGFADRTYIEPLDVQGVTDVLRRERPDAILPTLGGQTALNLAIELSEAGVLEELGVELLGARVDVIRRAEDTIPVPRRGRELWAAHAALADRHLGSTSSGVIAAPAVVRPAFTLGGHGGGFAETDAELRTIVERGLRESPITQVLVEESVRGWDEFELEVIRDLNDNVVIVCSIENLDPMGVHTGDSVTVAPQMTLSDEAYQELRDASVAIIRAVGVETGGSNIQFARSRETGEIRVIEMNPRVSRSSALASKATGYPIAKVAAKLAVGYTLDEIPNDLTKTTPASFEPTLDYVVVKFPRFAFEKFPGADATLGTQMKSVGESMGIGRTFTEAFLKAFGSRELDPGSRDAVGDVRRHPGRRPSVVQGAARATPAASSPRGHPARQARGLGRRLDRRRLGHERRRCAPRPLREGASGPRIAGSTRAPARSRPARTTTTRPGARRTRRCRRRRSRASSSSGPGPNRIGQGIEFDYCCVHAVQTFRVARLRGGDDQLQPGDRLDGLRHLRPPLLRAALARGGARRPRPRAAGGRGDPVRRPDAAAARPAHRGRRLRDHGHAARRDRSRRGPGALRRPRRRDRDPLPAVGDRRGGRRRRSQPRPRSAIRCSSGPPTCSAGARCACVTTMCSCARRWRRCPARCCSTGSSRMRSRSTSTRSATARRSTSPPSCSTSRKRASTPATPPVCCPRSRSRSRTRSRSSTSSSGSRPRSAWSAC